MARGKRRKVTLACTYCYKTVAGRGEGRREGGGDEEEEGGEIRY